MGKYLDIVRKVPRGDAVDNNTSVRSDSKDNREESPMYTPDTKMSQSEVEPFDLRQDVSSPLTGEFPKGDPTRVRGNAIDAVSHAGDVGSGIGLVARWSQEFNYISIYDATSGKWHDVPTKDAPGWAKREAAERKRLWRVGERRFLTAREMEAHWSKRLERRELSEREQEIASAASLSDCGLANEGYSEEV